MASVKLYLDVRKPRKDGTCPVKLAFSHNKSFLVPVGAYILPEQWDGKKVIIPNDRTEQKHLNDLIDNRFSNAKNIIRELRIMGKLRAVSDVELKAMVESNSIVIAKEETLLLLEEYYYNYATAIPNGTSRNNYLAALKKMKSHRDISNMPMSDITKDWIRSFDAFMIADGLTNNSRIRYLQNLRSVIYDAMEKDLVLMKNPFLKFKFPKYTPKKRALSVEDIKTIRDFQCEPFMEQYRDMFMLTFYLIGINAVDLFNLKKLRNGRVEYQRAKTDRSYSIKVEPEAMAIIEKYKGKTHLLNILDSYNNYRDYLHRMNDNLKKIGSVEYAQNATKPKGKRVKSGPLKIQYNGLFPDLSTYWARHSWATSAAHLDTEATTRRIPLSFLPVRTNGPALHRVY